MMRHLIKNLHFISQHQHSQFCHLTSRSQPLNISKAHRQQHWCGGVCVGEACLGEHHQHHDRQGILAEEARLGDVNHSMLGGSQYFTHSRSRIIPPGNCIGVDIIYIMIDKAL